MSCTSNETHKCSGYLSASDCKSNSQAVTNIASFMVELAICWHAIQLYNLQHIVTGAYVIKSPNFNLFSRTVVSQCDHDTVQEPHISKMYKIFGHQWSQVFIPLEFPTELVFWHNPGNSFMNYVCRATVLTSLQIGLHCFLMCIESHIIKVCRFYNQILAFWTNFVSLGNSC